jgi:SNF2 family DNA or RNA helicase
MIYLPYKYQSKGTQHVIDNKSAALLLDMGLGKTVLTATAIEYLTYQDLAIDKTLIVGPKRVVRDVWPEEFKKWDHLKHVKLSLIAGTPVQRLAALRVKADVYLISVDNIAWLVNLYQTRFPFDMLIIDESSMFKDNKSQRFKQLSTVTPQIDRKIILTGTPIPNGYHELWPQFYLLDGGERLGKKIGMFREEFFNSHAVKRDSFIQKYEIKKERNSKGKNIYEVKLLNKISDISLSMKKDDYLDLPKRINRYLDIDLPPHILKQYRKFEKEMVMQISDKDITASNAVSLCGKLIQFANGAIYDENRNVIEIHQEKLNLIHDVVQENEGANFLIAYWFNHDLSRLTNKFLRFKPQKLDSEQSIKDWNAGKIKVAFGHPKSLGHGLNMQYGGSHIFWFSNTYSREGYDQFNARLDRQGITKSVTIHHARVKKTIDINVLAAIADKGNTQDYAMKYLKDAKQRYLNT